MMDTINLFPTQIFLHKCDFDLENLFNKIKECEKNVPNESHSSVGGYQGRNFKDKDFEEKIYRYIPQRSDLLIKNYTLDAWVNINYPGSFNNPHEHLGAGAFLSGILYVKVPENSGKIVFHDPRHYMQLCSEPLMYYNGGQMTTSYTPCENELLLFPYWLVHSVEENNSNEERISISFNINMVNFK